MTAPDPRPAQSHLAKLRESRVRTERAQPLAGVFSAEARTLERERRRAAGVADVWNALCPPDLVNRTAIRSLRRGLLTIAVEDAPTRFELDRALRAGLEREIVRRCAAPVRRIRLVAP